MGENELSLTGVKNGRAGGKETRGLPSSLGPEATSSNESNSASGPQGSLILGAGLGAPRRITPRESGRPAANKKQTNVGTFTLNDPGRRRERKLVCRNLVVAPRRPGRERDVVVGTW